MSFDMSFGDGAGWGGDTSFSTETSGKDSEATKLGDKLPIPAQIPLLASLSDEKLAFGSMMFSTAYTIGDIVEVIGEAQNRQYKLADPQEPTHTFNVSAFQTSSDDASFAETLPTGTRVFAVGKLRALDGIVCLFSYKVYALENPLEYDCFVKEAEIAKLYWEKNVPSVLKRGDTHLTGCAAGMPAGRGEGGGGAVPSNSASSMGAVSRSNSAISHRPATAAPVDKKFGDVRDKVLELLKGQAKIATESGSDRKDLHVSDISRATNTDVKEVKKALEYLSQEGTIYCTVDDEHYETI